MTTVMPITLVITGVSREVQRERMYVGLRQKQSNQPVLG